MKAFVVERYGKDGLRAAVVPEPVVTGVGAAVRHFQAGDEIYARPRDLRIGTFAELIAIDQRDVAPKPASLTPHEAAAVPLVSLAAWQALVDRAHVKPGQKVLVHAGSGGLGSTAIQLAKHLGATVATTASGKNAELVRGLGADVVADYTKEDFAEVLSGYDVVLDSLGGENLEKSLTVLKPGGQAIGVAGPPDPEFAEQLGAPKFMGVAMGLLSRKVRTRTCTARARFPVISQTSCCHGFRATLRSPRRLASALDGGKVVVAAAPPAHDPGERGFDSDARSETSARLRRALPHHVHHVDTRGVALPAGARSPRRLHRGRR